MRGPHRQPFSLATRRKGSRASGTQAYPTKLKLSKACKLLSFHLKANQTRSCPHGRLNRFKLDDENFEFYIRTHSPRSIIFCNHANVFSRRRQDSRQVPCERRVGCTEFGMIVGLDDHAAQHSSNKRNRNRIRRSILRRLYTLNLAPDPAKVRHQRVDLLLQLQLFPKRQRANYTRDEKRRPTSRRVTQGLTQRSGQQSAQNRRKQVQYPTFGRSHTKVCTKSKSKERKYNVGTGRGQKRGRGFKYLREHYSVHAREMAKVLQHQPLSLS